MLQSDKRQATPNRCARNGSGHRVRGGNLTLLRDYDPADDRLGAWMSDPAVGRFERAEHLSIPVEKVSSSMFLNRVHRTVAAHWAAERDRCGGIPRAAWFDPLGVKPALGSLLLLEPVDGGLDFVYRVYGTVVAREAGIDWTGRRVGELHEPARSAFLSQYRAVCELGVAIYAEHDAPILISHVLRWCRLILPLTDSHDRINRLLVVNVAVQQDIPEHG